MPYNYDHLLPLFSSRMRRVAFAFLSESCGTSLVPNSRGTVLGEWEILLLLLLLFLLLLLLLLSLPLSRRSLLSVDLPPAELSDIGTHMPSCLRSD
jgi:hypothetical protein